MRRQRGAIKAKLTLTTNFATQVKEDLNIASKEEIESRIKILDNIYTRFQGISQQLVNTVPEEDYEQREAPEEADFDDRYCGARASLMQSLEKLTPHTSTNVGGSGQTSGQTGDEALVQVLE